MTHFDVARYRAEISRESRRMCDVILAAKFCRLWQTESKLWALPSVKPPPWLSLYRKMLIDQSGLRLLYFPRVSSLLILVELLWTFPVSHVRANRHMFRFEPCCSGPISTQKTSRRGNAHVRSICPFFRKQASICHCHKKNRKWKKCSDVGPVADPAQAFEGEQLNRGAPKRSSLA